jgi:hypothetical protein
MTTFTAALFILDILKAPKMLSQFLGGLDQTSTGLEGVPLTSCVDTLRRFESSLDFDIDDDVSPRFEEPTDIDKPIPQPHLHT